MWFSYLQVISGTERLSLSYPLFGIELHCARFYSQETSFDPNCSQIHGLPECLTSLLTEPRSPCLLPVGAKGFPLIKKQAALGVSSSLPDSGRALILYLFWADSLSSELLATLCGCRAVPLTQGQNEDWGQVGFGGIEEVPLKGL